MGQQPGRPHPQVLRRRAGLGGRRAGRDDARRRRPGHPVRQGAVLGPRGPARQGDRRQHPPRLGDGEPMKPVFYVPERGDLVLVSFAPRSGRAQAGRRPAVVLSPQAYNARVGLAILCPVVTEAKGYPFEVPLPRSSPPGASCWPTRPNASTGAPCGPSRSARFRPPSSRKPSGSSGRSWLEPGLTSPGISPRI
ncbi:MAG: type II toxin-antitoxin system PemK/MazF family toxin [Desulfobacterales bacterium]|nr:type II toxin-antitoxin system PemK/MazF family toxin [Desulfobacterales bacterium]